MTRLYRLPNSKVTEKHEEYVKAWEEFAQPVCETFGWDLAGFDPTFQFWRDDKHIVSMEVCVVADLRAGLRKLHAHIESLKETNQVNRTAIMAMKEMLANSTKTET